MSDQQTLPENNQSVQDAAEANAAIVDIAGRIVKAAMETNDPRLHQLKDYVVELLKDGPTFEALLVMFASQSEEKSPYDMTMQPPAPGMQFQSPFVNRNAGKRR